MGIGTLGFAQAYARSRPDILLVLGDRFEMHAAAVAALPFKIPLAHIHGGEVTQGAIDESLRHAITKMSHLHFVATEEYARRVRQLGEEPWRITVSGAPALDNLQTVPLLSGAELAERCGVRVGEGFLLATYHPVTLEYESTERQAAEFLAALEASERPVLFTMPNADTRGRSIRQMILRFVAEHPTSQAVENLGVQGYFSAMARASAMVGNSSSGVVEAASFKLPVVNVGNRQQGRVMARNVICVECQREKIAQGIATATSSEFRSGLDGLVNPYGDGRAAERIVERLRGAEIDDRLVIKRFCDLPVEKGALPG
jgi:UDP-N-acetylglucosamine 2-epimerase (non-hydrolysing)/GDP/UDP-N,N'-diacetylbacillosamine 2-epimerase (hydrolysing)